MDILKSLHVCNLANVAYGYCKILRNAGDDARLICHDINHVMSQPEWDDEDLGLEDFPDENNFFRSVRPIQLKRPEWYMRVDIAHYNRPHIKYLSKILPHSVRKYIRPLYFRLAYASHVGMLSQMTYKDASADGGYAESDAMKFIPNITWLKNLRRDEDVIFAYVLAPVYAMLCQDRPYVAVEIGTMRDLPFEDSPSGRLLSAAYRQAGHVLITNPDVRVQAERLGLTHYSFCPHPVDEDRYMPQKSMELRNSTLKDLPDTDLIGIAPARQNWLLKGNHKYLEALRVLRFERNIRVSLVIPAWGQEIARSKDLAIKLGVHPFIKWMPPVSESTLIRMYSSFDFVLDQFNLGVFGLITPKALSCGAPVVTSYNRAMHVWCFPEHPPLLSASDVADIVKSIENLLSSETRYRLSIESRAWFMRYHSKKIVRQRLVFAAQDAMRNFNAARQSTT